MRMSLSMVWGRWYGRSRYLPHPLQGIHILLLLFRFHRCVILPDEMKTSISPSHSLSFICPLTIACHLFFFFFSDLVLQTPEFPGERATRLKFRRPMSSESAGMLIFSPPVALRQSLPQLPDIFRSCVSHAVTLRWTQIYFNRFYFILVNQKMFCLLVVLFCHLFFFCLFLFYR